MAPGSCISSLTPGIYCGVKPCMKASHRVDIFSVIVTSPHDLTRLEFLYYKTHGPPSYFINYFVYYYNHLQATLLFIHLQTMGNVCKAPKSPKISDPQQFNDRYTMLDHIGEGGFGTVYTCVDSTTGAHFAAKLIENSKVEEWSKSDLEQVPIEVKTLVCCDHPNIIKLIDYFIYYKHSILIMEKPLNHVDLFNYTAYLGGVCETDARIIMQQIVEAVWYLHYDARIVHRDIKPENVLIDVRNQSCKLIDFGSAGWIHPYTYTNFSGTRLYAPPEVLVSGKYKAEPLTAWSLGATLYFTIFSRLAFSHEDDVKRSTLLLPSSFPLAPACLHFMQSCLHPDPLSRPTVDQLNKHPWLVNF